MLTVFALALQNTFGRLFPKETHGPTTMMTGNVTQASLDLGNLLFKGPDTIGLKPTVYHSKALKDNWFWLVVF